MSFLNLPVNTSKLKQIKVEGGYQIVIKVQTKGNLVLDLELQLLKDKGAWLWKCALSVKGC